MSSLSSLRVWWLESFSLILSTCQSNRGYSFYKTHKKVIICITGWVWYEATISIREDKGTVCLFVLTHTCIHVSSTPVNCWGSLLCPRYVIQMFKMCFSKVSIFLCMTTCRFTIQALSKHPSNTAWILGRRKKKKASVQLQMMLSSP